MRDERLYKPGKSPFLLSNSQQQQSLRESAHKGESMHHHVLRTHSSLWGSGSEAEIPFSYLTAFSRCSWNLFCHFVTQCRGPCDSYTAQLHCAEKHFFPVLWTCSQPVTLDAASSSAGEAQGALIPQASPPDSHRHRHPSCISVTAAPEEWEYSSSFHFQTSFFALITLVALLYISSSGTVTF